MRTKKELRALLNTVHDIRGYNISLSSGRSYYGVLGRTYSHHFKCFKNMHSRVKRNSLEVDFSLDGEGLVDFIRYIGDIPAGMVKPTVGRQDHSLGYVRGNFAWQEHDENSGESNTRGTRGNWGTARRELIAKRESELVAVFKHSSRLAAAKCAKLLGITNTVYTYYRVKSLMKRGYLPGILTGLIEGNWVLSRP